MKISQFIERAIEGGWKYDDYCDGGCGDRHIFLDPRAWQAVGKVEGWGSKEYSLKYWYKEMPSSHKGDPYPKMQYGGGDIKKLLEWQHHMHAMIDHLIEGGTIESYLENL